MYFQKLNTQIFILENSFNMKSFFSKKNKYVKIKVKINFVF